MTGKRRIKPAEAYLRNHGDVLRRYRNDPLVPIAINARRLLAHWLISTAFFPCISFRMPDNSAIVMGWPHSGAPMPFTDSEDSAVPAWMNVWGVVACALGIVALLSASTVGIRLLTVLVSAIGLGTALVGCFVGNVAFQTKDRAWLAFGGFLCAWVLALAAFVPGLLNSYWVLNRTVERVEPDKQFIVPRDQLRDAGRSAAPDEGADALTEAIRQHDVIIRVESVKLGTLPDKGRGSYLLIHLGLANSGGEAITIQGFGRDKHTPALTDQSGRAFAFLDQRQRIPAKGAPVFAAATGGIELAPPNRQDYLLIFETPLTGLKPAALNTPAKLEVPSSAWGRNGVCQFTIPKLFDFIPPSPSK